MRKTPASAKPSAGRTLALATLCLMLMCAGLVYYIWFARGHGEMQTPASSTENTDTIAYRALPYEAQQTYTLVFRGGPFTYQNDGAVFGNYEQRLPQRTRGYYREYTVKTPGINHRGVRRIVCGGSEPTRPRVCYYTANHYTSFRQIVDVPISR